VRRLALIGTALGVLAGIGLLVLGLTARAPLPAQRSLSDVHVAGYQRYGEADESGPGSTDATIVYGGPPASPAEFVRRISGTGVSVKLLKKEHTGLLSFDGMTMIAEGAAPGKGVFPGQRCYLGVARYPKGGVVYSWWGVTRHQIAQTDTGELGLFLVFTVCGTS
jgi:hypothetical protein